MEDIRTFLEGADSEPLLWEAKGTELDPYAVRKEICGFANGRQPAFLILGAAKDTGTWDLSGLDFDGDPPAWISNVISEGLRPLPMIDVRSIKVSAGKHVAVVEVPPVAIAPCICRGTVYERVSGRTVPVKEPLRLADLYGRGDIARRQARMAASDLARELFQDPGLPGANDPWPRVAVAVA
ncbi:MAG TPA: RNA-binding domain-containing protein, partial [Fimbriimonadaceae bacterium]|nr:RNA-binding domain-containing protein [Fimbriimonadaceae bacterium]